TRSAHRREPTASLSSGGPTPPRQARARRGCSTRRAIFVRRPPYPRPRHPARGVGRDERGAPAVTSRPPPAPPPRLRERPFRAPPAWLVGSSGARLAGAISFDKGLGDLFVVRNAGQVVSDSVIGSLEYAIAVLEVPLLVVLGHDACGAVRAAIDSTGEDAPPL